MRKSVLARTKTCFIAGLCLKMLSEVGWRMAAVFAAAAAPTGLCGRGGCCRSAGRRECGGGGVRARRLLGCRVRGCRRSYRPCGWGGCCRSAGRREFGGGGVRASVTGLLCSRLPPLLQGFAGGGGVVGAPGGANSAVGGCARVGWDGSSAHSCLIDARQRCSSVPSSNARCR